MDIDMWLSSNDGSNDKTLEKLEDDVMVINTTMVVCANMWEFFSPNELKDGGQGVVDHNCSVHDAPLHMRTVPYNFKTFMNFTVVDFDEFFGLVVPIIASRARSTGEVHKLLGCPMRLFPQQHLFNFSPLPEM